LNMLTLGLINESRQTKQSKHLDGYNERRTRQAKNN
jgi:hypothetical protein